MKTENQSFSSLLKPVQSIIISIKTALIVFFFLNMAAKVRPKMLFNTLLKIKPDNKERRSSKKK